VADNIAITPGAGATVATDDVGGVQYQRVKSVFGPDGTATDVAPGVAGLPTAGAYLEASGVLSSAGSAVTVDVRGYSYVMVYVPPQVTAVLTMTFEWSGDNGVSWAAGTFDVVAGYGDKPGRGSTYRVVNATACLGSPVRAPKFRVRSQSWTSGTGGVTVYIYATAGSCLDFSPTVWSAVAYDSSFTIPAVGVMGADAANAMRQLKTSTDGTLATTTTKISSATGTMSTLAATTSASSVLSANTNRLAFAVFNDSTTATLYLAFSATAASLTAYTVQVPPKGFYESTWGPVVWTGTVGGIWDAAVGNARITEWAA
jgi:hypothetical protein